MNGEDADSRAGKGEGVYIPGVNNPECRREVKKRVRADWSGRRRVAG